MAFHRENGKIHPSTKVCPACWRPMMYSEGVYLCWNKGCPETDVPMLESELKNDGSEDHMPVG